MRPIIPIPKIGHISLVLAEEQSEYIPLPVLIDEKSVVTTEWELDADELSKLLEGGRVRLKILTFGHPLQPIMLDVTND